MRVGLFVEVLLVVIPFRALVGWIFALLCRCVLFVIAQMCSCEWGVLDGRVLVTVGYDICGGFGLF